MARVLTFRVGQLCWQHHSLIGGFSWRWSYTLLGDLRRLSALILLAVADPEVIGPLVLVLRVSSFIMAVPAGRSVVFVTGNAKKLEEVKSQTFHTRETLHANGRAVLSSGRILIYVSSPCFSSLCSLSIDSELQFNPQLSCFIWQKSALLDLYPTLLLVTSIRSFRSWETGFPTN